MSISRRAASLSLAASLVAFCVVQDRVTAAGARRYADLQRAAMAGAGPAITIDGVMTPAVRRSVRAGLFAAAATAAAGLAAGAAVHRRDRRG